MERTFAVDKAGQRADLAQQSGGCNVRLKPKEGLRDYSGPYLRTKEAAEYLRKSTSWLLRQHDIPFLPGNPNVYKRADLDDWFERSKLSPRVV